MDTKINLIEPEVVGPVDLRCGNSSVSISQNANPEGSTSSSNYGKFSCDSGGHHDQKPSEGSGLRCP